MSQCAKQVPLLVTFCIPPPLVLKCDTIKLSTLVVNKFNSDNVIATILSSHLRWSLLHITTLWDELEIFTICNQIPRYKHWNTSLITYTTNLCSFGVNKFNNDKVIATIFSTHLRWFLWNITTLREDLEISIVCIQTPC